MHDRLRFIDPESANAIRPSDRSGIVRALEVSRRRAAHSPARSAAVAARSSTDRVAAWSSSPNARSSMTVSRRAPSGWIAEGAMEEARALVALGLDPELPAMKAIGVRELGDHIAGRASLSEAIAGIKTETRRYAKRQLTWFRHQMADWPRIASVEAGL